MQRRRPLVAVEDNYDRLGYASDDITRDARYSRYAAETVMLRSHTTAGVPPALRRLATDHRYEPSADVLLALPGLRHRRDSIDRLHVGTPHQVDLWRITTSGQPDEAVRLPGTIRSEGRGAGRPASLTMGSHGRSRYRW
ncbi:hypothetical protein [Micromonospora sp. NPDC049799]|uniref:hypothetical protein n=1 Tax=Micromonospora sp. NPDC049799 TaxID=3154741 RepID=UPI0033EECCDC